MSELLPITEQHHAHYDANSPWTSDVQAMYFRKVDTQTPQGVPRGDGTKPGDGHAATPPAETTVKLKTGDTLTMAADGQILQTPAGDKIILQREFDGSTLSSGWAMFDKKGNQITDKYSHTICSMPEVTVSKMSNGARLEQRAGVSTISYPNGDHIQLDVWGVTEIKRGNTFEHIRQPIVQPLQLPVDPNRKYKV